MSYNEKIADRTREIISLTHEDVIEKKMFGGLCFMVNDKMCVGVMEDKIMVRLNPLIYEEVMKKEGCHQMDFSGKPMKGFVFVDFEVLDTKKKLVYWIELALDFNQIAKTSKKKKKR